MVDGGIDETLTMAQEFATSHRFAVHVEVLAFSSNQGKGAAVKRGVEHAKGAVIGYTDADLPFGMDVILDGLRLLEESVDVELVVGDRNDSRSKAEERPPVARRIAGCVYSWLVGSLVDTGVTDTQCGLKLIRAIEAKLLFSRTTLPGFGFDVELLHIAKRAGMRVKTMPVILQHHDGSSVRLVPDSLKMFSDLLRIRKTTSSGLYDLDWSPPCGRQ